MAEDVCDLLQPLPALLLNRPVLSQHVSLAAQLLDHPQPQVQQLSLPLQLFVDLHQPLIKLLLQGHPLLNRYMFQDCLPVQVLLDYLQYLAIVFHRAFPPLWRVRGDVLEIYPPEEHPLQFLDIFLSGLCL